MTDHIILYGSLRFGEPAFDALGLAKRLRHRGETRFAGRLYDLGDFPGLRLGGDGQVVGDRFEILEPAVVGELDGYEMYRPHDTGPYDAHSGTGSLYLRRTILVDGVAGGQTLAAYIYEYNLEPAPPGDGAATLVGHGDWLRYLKERAAQSGA